MYESEGDVSDTNEDNVNIPRSSASTTSTTVPLFQRNISDVWNEVDCSNLRFDIHFSGSAWYNDHPDKYPKNRDLLTPFHVYSIFLDEDILNLLTQETNRNAEQQRNKKYLHDGLESINGNLLIITKCEHFWASFCIWDLRTIFSIMQRKFSENAVPGETLVVDESMDPFRGRLLFRQYISSKRHRYGLKIFKMCNTFGYTNRLSMYTGQNFWTAPWA
ncbi:hypothetical protein NQ314_016704 [Rhamnusium bicolor]|uniref:PiggyBac transposable element-derived protein domain-containing protein n=1 Tax=Rhamnusium bicolor TaxID=1586634 RepID=A0AAV8WWC7_9CUCU|nr:hypothetical protein NQ314_016704 [Rhamnusium bicolor]